MKKCTVLANSTLFKAHLLYFAIFFIGCTLGILMEPRFSYFWIGLLLLHITTCCCITDRWCLLLTFRQKDLLYQPLFRKGSSISYSHYPRILYAYYMHGNLFAAYKVHFFIFTNRLLTDDELSHIHEVAPSKDLIKIRYTRNTYRKLISALPSSIAVDIERIYATYIQK